MPASNRGANYVFGFLALVGLYLTYVYFPLYWDNVELKQAARTWISANRSTEEKWETKALREFRGNVMSLGLKLDENACVFTRVDERGGSVACDYVRVVEFPPTSKTRTLRFRWTVKQKFHM